ncbi:hypothetical protein VMCG_02212 [Cytospora schulzeri]|uniref:J domain-containing protein n=1 Tax=Cytospora schulzeri TaxID=448051 RepID=A0A423X1G4_9PEZI|nr:hypothetical protein VMCG_02212 [Valsa malicola]
MVKIDYNQDYYADLEVGPSAGIEDIRRSYRKLALKYHPDRNPGSETAAGQRFQIIQAAYEVLTNAEQKQKYDISRRTRYGGASGVRGNPYQDISKNYPPPPRPPGFAPRTAQKRPPATSAADTYAKFAKDVPPTSPRTSRKPAESTFTWQAWEQMKSGTKGKATSSQATGSGASARPSSAPKPAPAAPPPVPPRSPQKQAKGSFGSRVNRGYTPHSPSGDEPPVASNNYFTTRARENPFSETSGDEPPVASNNYSTRTRQNPFTETTGDEPPVASNNYFTTRARENPFGETSGDEPPVASNNYFTNRTRQNLFSETSKDESPVASNNYTTRTRQHPFTETTGDEPPVASNNYFTNRTRQNPFSETLQDESPVASNNYTTRTRESPFSKTSGDEPPVASSNYFTTRTRENLFGDTPAAAPVRPRETPDPGPAADLGDSTSADTKQRTPCRDPDGEKLDPSLDANVNQSHSTRESTRGPYRDDEGDSPTTSSQQRSASPPNDSETGPQGPPEGKEGGKGVFTGGNDAAAAQNGSNPTFESLDPGHQRKQDSGDHSTMPDAQEANVGDTGSNDRANSKLYASQPHFRSQLPAHKVPRSAQKATGRAGDEKFFEKKTLNLAPELHELLSRQSSSEDKSTFNNGLNAFDHKMHSILSRLSAIKYSTSYGLDMHSGGLQNAAQPQRVPQQMSNADNNNAHSFDFPYAEYSFTPDLHRFTRNSADNINTRFVADDSDATNWQFNAGSPISETGRPAMPRSKSGSRISRKALPLKAPAAQTPFTEPTNGNAPAPNSSFNPEEWSEKIGPQIFQAPGQTQKGSTIRPIRNPSKKPKSVRMTAGTAGMVESDENSSGQEDNLQKSPATADANDLSGIASPNAMDIDNPLEVNGVRNINYEPSRPEWRAGDVKGMKADAKPAADPQTETVPPVGGSEDSEEFRATLSDLRNVEPFAQPTAGLESFGDLKTNLPFPSGASGQVPFQKGPSKPVKLDLPDAPKPPNAPPTLAVQGLKPSAAAWTKYVGDFYRYLTEWHAYSTKFSDHFQARNVEVQKKLSNPGWVESRDGAGVQEYLRWAEEDRQVRAKWTEACHSHEMNVRVFVAHRDKMMK